VEDGFQNRVVSDGTRASNRYERERGSIVRHNGGLRSYGSRHSAIETYDDASPRPKFTPRQLQNNDDDSNSNAPTPICTSTILQPDQSLLPNQFLCLGHLRLGISSSTGRFLLGLSSTPDYGADVLPSQIVWIAQPNSLNLFSNPSDGKNVRFHEVVLSSRGNLVGYDADGNQIYDSNYDYSARLEGKEDDSILTFSSACIGESWEDIPEGEWCVRLTSPPTAGFPYGVVTWGLQVDLDVDLELEEEEEVEAVEDLNVFEDVPESSALEELGDEDEEAQTLTVTDVPTVVPTGQPTTDVPTKQPTTESSTAAATGNNGGSSGGGSNSGNIDQFSGNAIIWGTVWLDENQNSLMDYAEERMAEVKVDLYECSNDQSESSPSTENDDDTILMDSTYTSIDGMYFFQVAQGGMYRAHFNMEGRPYSYSASDAADANGKDSNGDGAIDREGWTQCQLSTSVSPIEWNAGLISTESLAMEEDAAMDGTDGGAVEEIAEDAKQKGDLDDSMQSFEVEDYPEQDIAADFPAAAGSAEGNAESSSMAALETSFVSEEQGQQSQQQQPPSSSVDSSPISAATASIGGSVYLDLNANGIIDGKEGFSANDGFAIDDATVQVLLIDCETNNPVDYPNEVTIPGIYSFSNLNAGTFQVKFAVLHLSPDGTVGSEDPLYSFLDEKGVDTESSKKKSECMSLASGQVIDDLNAGLFPIPVEVEAKSADGISPVPENAPLEAFSASAADEEDNAAGGERASLRASASSTAQNGGQNGNKKSVIAGAIGGVFACCIFALGLFAMMRRRKDSSSHRVKEMLSRASSVQDGPSGDARSIGSSVKDDFASRTDNKSLDSMFVEVSVAGGERTNLVPKPGVDDDSDSDSDSDSSSDDSDSDSSSNGSGGEESSDQPFSENEEGSIEISDDGHFVVNEKSNVPEKEKIVKKDVMRKPSVDLDQNRYQHPYHSSISVTSDTFSDGPFESSDDESESSAEIMKHLTPHLKSQQSLSSTGESSGSNYTDGTMGQDNFEDSSAYPSYQENQGNMTEQQYQQQNQDQDSRYYSDYQHPNQPSYPALYSNMEDEASCSELSATHSHSSNDHVQYRNYVRESGNVPDHRGYGRDQQPHHSHQGYHHQQPGEWDRSQYGAHGHVQYYDQQGQPYDYQYQYANSIGYDGSHYDYGDARSADPPAASYQQLSDNQNSDINDGRHDYGYNEWDRRSPSSDQGIEVHDHVYYQGHHSVGYQNPTRTENSFISVATTDTAETAQWSNVSSKQRPKSTPRNWRQTDDAIPENDSIHHEAYMTSNDTNYYDRNAADDANDTKSILSAGSDQSSDPPGASYKVLQFPPPPPRRLPPPPPPRR